MAALAKPDKQRLPKKEAETFKNIVKFYETKQYKKGLKAADLVLKKHPEHGETLAMKGLVLNCLDRKTEAYDHVKKGLRADMRSHVCWHVYGLLYRSDRNYEQAIKSYKQALKIDSDNVQILRDLSLLQVQLRDTRGFLETRRRLLTLKSTNKMHWIAYAVANHLDGKGSEAIKVIDAYGETVKEEGRERNYENSELALYRNLLLEESGKYDEALDHLDACKSVVVDGDLYSDPTNSLENDQTLFYATKQDFRDDMNGDLCSRSNYGMANLCKVVKVCRAKCTAHFTTSIIRGAGCNWMVCLAIWLQMIATEPISKFIMIWLPIELFISSGFDHLVVNEFLIPGGIIVGGSYIDSRVNFLNAFWNNFIPVTIGSVIGAWFLVFPSWLVNKDGWEAKLKREAEAAGAPAEKLTEA